MFMWSKSRPRNWIPITSRPNGVAPWKEPTRRAGHLPPRLVVLHSPYRQFYESFLGWLQRLTALHPERHVVVLIPELVHRRWYHFVVVHRATRLKALLLLAGGPHVSVLSTPWYPDLQPANRRRWLGRLDFRSERRAEPASRRLRSLPSGRSTRNDRRPIPTKLNVDRAGFRNGAPLTYLVA
jgi:hypothetical protein